MRLRNIAWVLLGLAILAVGFLPATRVPIIGDDFYVILQAQGMSHGDIGTWAALAWGWGMQAGHFNPVGQVIGGMYHFFSLPISAAFNISPSYYYQIGSFAVLLLAVIAATYFFTQTLQTILKISIDGWGAKYFALIAAITGITIQVHPWSNDPVTTYSMAGFGSAAVGFWLLGLTMRAIRPGTRPVWTTALLASVAVFSVVYYELLVAAVAASALILTAGLFKKTALTDAPRTRIWYLIGFGVVLPAVVFISGRLYVSLVSGTGGYTGTVIGGPLDGVKTFIYSLISSIPGGAWLYSFYRVNPMILSRPAFIAAAVLSVLIIVFAIGWFKSSPQRFTRYPHKIWIPLLALLIFWGLSTAAQAFTAKYIVEITAPGLVYLFYSIGLLTLSVILAALVLLIPANRLMAMGSIILAGTIWFGINQETINWTLSTQMESAYRVNSELAAAITNSNITEEQRCQRLARWAERPWPEYYRSGVLENLTPTYQRLKGQDFCTSEATLSSVTSK